MIADKRCWDFAVANGKPVRGPLLGRIPKLSEPQVPQLELTSWAPEVFLRLLKRLRCRASPFGRPQFE